MRLGEDGEARVRGYLYVLERALRSFLEPAVVVDAVREVRSHIEERVAQADPSPNEQAALDRVLAELGPPLRVAQAYAMEMTVEEAAATGRVVPVLRAVWHFATTTTTGFLAALVLFVGYALGAGCVLLATLQPVFPDRVGLLVVDGVPRAFGMVDVPPGGVVHGGYWIIPVGMVCGVGLLVLTHKGARALVSWWRGRRAPWHAQ
jgi:hypothetical protein